MYFDFFELIQFVLIFCELFKGYYISYCDFELYIQLFLYQDQYCGLFCVMGFELVCDICGFYYFVLEQVGVQVNKIV